jgi:hypothetical protein
MAFWLDWMLVKSARLPFITSTAAIKLKNAIARVVVRLRAARGLFSFGFVIIITS